MRIESPSKERAARYGTIVCKSQTERANERSAEIGNALGVASSSSSFPSSSSFIVFFFFFIIFFFFFFV